MKSVWAPEHSVEEIGSPSRPKMHALFAHALCLAAAVWASAQARDIAPPALSHDNDPAIINVDFHPSASQDDHEDSFDNDISRAERGFRQVIELLIKVCCWCWGWLDESG